MQRIGFILLGFACLVLIGQALSHESNPTEQESDKTSAPKDEELLVSLGVNSNSEIAESSGVAISSFVKDAIWTHNDSGHKNRLFLLKTDGKLLAYLDLQTSQNSDWESMVRFNLDGKSYLMVGDVGDNTKRRKNYQLYVVPEPDLSASLTNAKPDRLPVRHSVKPVKLDFTYEDGPKNCEAIAVDVLARQIWLVEKIYVDPRIKTPPGIYVLPLSIQQTAKPLVAKRIADFPPRNVSGMDFSPDGKRLIIRNYVNAHLYVREKNETWEESIKTTNPASVVLPLQRQGEAVCFTNDSRAIILTSEFLRQPIWQVKMDQYFELPRRMKKKTPVDGESVPEELGK